MTAPHAAPPPPPVARLLRPAMAMLAGLGIMALIYGVGVLIATLAALRHGDPSTFTWYILTVLALSVVGGAAAGFATSRITAGRSFYTVFVLALILLTPGIAPLVRGTPADPRFPSWYPVALAVLRSAGALVGGLVERRGSRR